MAQRKNLVPSSLPLISLLSLHVSGINLRILVWSDAEILCAKGILTKFKYIIDRCADVGHLWLLFSSQVPRWNISSVQFSHSVVSDSLRLHESQHTRPPCPSPTPGLHSDSRPLSQWCHPAISSSVVPFSSCPQPIPPSESFPMSQLFPWGGQSTGVSALASFLPKKSQGWTPSEWTG